eukprot:gnl/TRDRNA2_/TRDRNA2_93117_c0_seq1.p1 gnl/TRDRNA2_/TRDRNA2_93117_c0~~gnl/TRDRNA2_/TRDRNA2_93117_c0_seq1.p1  ORF type:complete len:428 (-),score=59.65 gnl/TRDRNA2_/TRDRNA2_93117_c0_seq1:11-1294(-)
MKQQSESQPLQCAAYSDAERERLQSKLCLANWDKGGEISRFAFLNTGQVLATAIIKRDGPTSRLQRSAVPAAAKIGSSQIRLCERQEEDEPECAPGPRLLTRVVTIDGYVDACSLDGIIILHKGKIVYERYPRMRQCDRHIIFSVGKVVVSTLVAMLEDRGQVSVEKPIDFYLPELASSGWRGVRVIDILDMASGIDAPEEVPGAYTNPKLKNYQHEASLGWLPKVEAVMPKVVITESTYEFLATLSRCDTPGKEHDYASVNTTVLVWLVERITGTSFAEVLSQEIWSRIGAEDDGLVTVNSRGIAAGHGGIITTLRDLARFGLLFTPSFGVVCTDRLVSSSCVQKICKGGRPSLLSSREHGELHSTYQWDQVWADGSFFKSGFGGQGLYIHTSKDLVLAFFGTHGYNEHRMIPPEDVFRELLVGLF